MQPSSNANVLRMMITAVGTLFCIVALAAFCYNLILSSGTKEAVAQEKAADVTIMDKYDMYVTNAISDALEGVLAIEKVYWLSDNDMVAPEPNQACFGEVNSYEELKPILEQAEELLEGQTLTFTPDRPDAIRHTGRA